MSVERAGRTCRATDSSETPGSQQFCLGVVITAPHACSSLRAENLEVGTAPLSPISKVQFSV